MVAKIIRRFRNNLITGFLLIIPLGATIFVIKWLLTTVDNLISKNWFPGVGLLVVLTIAFLTGLLAKNYFGRMIIDTGNAIFANIPLMNKIYLGIQQIVDAVAGTNKRLFEKAVLLEYPKEGSFCIGFMTSQTSGEIPRKVGVDMVSVFVPTTPNPTSGFLLFLPTSKVVELDMSVETAIKLVMSAGMVNSDTIKETDPMYELPKHLKKFDWLNIRKRKTPDPRD